MVAYSLMITDQDITKLKRSFATKEEFADLCIEVGELKEEVGELRETMNEGFESLHIKMDRFLGNIETVQMDNPAGSQILGRQTQQIEYLAANAGIVLPNN